jgi:hypothetical protein
MFLTKSRFSGFYMLKTGNEAKNYKTTIIFFRSIDVKYANLIRFMVFKI